ncbi:hypothetical protein [Streptomyces rhizosphaericus]|uniref:Uncharacterized protein n=1 Tax=Streptomyces rhizosphaericus TaxID=114699 RepID=A0A6G4A7K9_9ACTN|nr:hypothetical protein [Streptomyces rhizosphaericus]NEW69252.1 hypothetical protein [Streptomyces rhizosphaericus]
MSAPPAAARSREQPGLVMQLGSAVAAFAFGVATTVVALWRPGRVGERMSEGRTDLRCGKRRPSSVVAHESGGGNHVRG